MTPASRRVGTGVALAAVIALALVFVRDHLGSLDDDAYVYLRYARNLRDGCGLRWNCDDTPVEAFHSPAWLALVVLASRVTPSLVVAAEACAVVVLGALLVAALSFADQLAARAATVPESAGRTRIAVVVAVGLALATDHEILQGGTLGIDAPLLALAVTLFAAAVLARRRWLAVLALLGAALVRPECAVLALALPFVPRFGRLDPASTTRRADADARRLLWLVLLSGLALEVGVRFALFGDLVPNLLWAQTLGTPRQATPSVAPVVSALLTFPALALAPAVLASSRVRREAGALLGAFALWMGVSFFTGGDALGGARFASPLVPVCTAFAALGAVVLVERFVRPSLGPAAALALATLLAARASLHRQPPLHGFADVHARAEIATRVRRLAPGARIAAIPIGALGLYSHSNVLDLIGLTRRDIALRRAPLLDMLERERPDVIVTTASSPRRYASLADVRPATSLERQIVDGVRTGQLGYHPVDMELAPGSHWLLFALDSGAEGEHAP